MSDDADLAGDLRLAVRFLVIGRVQGVGFRAAARREAQDLGVHGHALNRDDGSVEVVAEGLAQSMQAFADWLHRGPALAAVKEVRSEAIAATGRSGFGVG